MSEPRNARGIFSALRVTGLAAVRYGTPEEREAWRKAVEEEAERQDVAIWIWDEDGMVNVEHADEESEAGEQ
jgi:hypothetical protein